MRSGVDDERENSRYATFTRTSREARVETVHNPDHLMSDLRQILSQGRKRIGFLIGAGAPMSMKVDADNHLASDGNPLIPGVDELTKVVVKGLQDRSLREAAAAIKAELGPSGNIETILSKIRLLEQALGDTKVRGLDGEGYSKLANAICESIGNLVKVQLPIERTSYNELIAWISGTARSHPIEIFTTNYDLLLEEAFERARAPYFDGFSGGNAPFFDPVTIATNDLPARWSRLWKLHGSLGWSLEGGIIVRRQDREANALIYPDHLKYELTQKQPYTALFQRLTQFLLTPDTLLLVVGFSFRDPHIAAALDEALATNSNAAVFAFQFDSLENEDAALRIALERPNLSVYASDGAVVSSIAGKWRLGELPKNWIEIRKSFWGARGQETSHVFTLGDFAKFARFCALAQATELRDLSRSTDGPVPTSTEVGNEQPA